MHFTTALVSTLATLAVASPLDIFARAHRRPDNSKLIIAGIANISADLTALNKTLNTFQPNSVLGLPTALKIQQQTNALAAQINATAQAAKASRKFNDKKSALVAAPVLDLIDPINTTLTNIVAHKPAFATAVLFVGDLTKTVEQALITQRKLTLLLGNNLTAKLSEVYASVAPEVIDQIISGFDYAIAKYKKCSGVLCLPPV